ncbi:MAG: hypothetical protein E6K94_00850 [Thaumarchaeota archaeon]|nr:MAG: hypothetical protein E6K94_00850 [Nitrososphaerota archaeon]
MPKRFFNSLDDFKNNLHKYDASLIDYNGNLVPCIYINSDRYHDIISKVAGKKLAVDVLLDLFHDSKHVFVDILMTYLDYNFDENYLFYANDMPQFFEALARTGLIAIAPSNAETASQLNLLVIQLPRKDSAENAFNQMIKIINKQSQGHEI